MNNAYDILNRDAIRPGDIICRDSGRFIGKAIKWATSTPESKTLWNHDAIVVPQRGHLCIGDALLGRECQLTVVWEWEQGCRKHGHKLIVLRPANATAEPATRRRGRPSPPTKLREPPARLGARASWSKCRGRSRRRARSTG